MKNVGARFRNRKINNKQLLHVYRAVDIPDLDETLNLQRSIPQTETGVDKEEETVCVSDMLICCFIYRAAFRAFFCFFPPKMFNFTLLATASVGGQVISVVFNRVH
jgi:hypothetical protein